MITIVHGPPGCGKTRNALMLVAFFGCHACLDLDEFEKRLRKERLFLEEAGVLLLTTEAETQLRDRYPNAKIVAFAGTALPQAATGEP